MRGPLEWTLFGLAAVPFLILKSYAVHAWFAFRKCRRGARAVFRGGVSVIVPLRGRESGLRENLLSLAAQEIAGDYEVLFCVEDARDEAVPIVREVLAQAPPGRARLVFSGPAGLELGKLHNLMAGVDAAKGATLVFVDGDARAPSPSYLSAFIAPLASPDTGLVTCYPVYRGGRDAGALLIAGMVNVDLLGTFAIRSAWGGGGFANGACMALRRETLERAGGLDPLRQRLLMDSRLAQNVARLGLRIVVHRDPIAIPRERMSLRAVWEQSTRWHVAMFRGLHLWTWLAFGWVRCALAIAIVFVLAAPESLVARGLLVGMIGLRMGQAARMPGAGWRLEDVVRRALAQPIADLAGAFAWLEAMAIPTVRWRERRYRVGRGGVLTLVTRAEAKRAPEPTRPREPKRAPEPKEAALAPAE